MLETKAEKTIRIEQVLQEIENPASRTTIRKRPASGTVLFLAVDLDGTFLGGSEEDRKQLYELIENRRDDIVLAFVTGRDIAFAGNLGASGHAPAPDLIIGDVGTSVALAPDWRPHAAMAQWIEARWPGEGTALRIMARHPHLRPQPVVGGRRLSYFYEDQSLADRAAREIEAAGYDTISSAGLFFDVLPRGVRKGTTLLQVLSHLGIAPDSVLTAGDTMNDLSLFETGLKGVAVGNAEPRLRQAIAPLSNVHVARAEGCGGIIEALHHFDLVPPARDRASFKPDRELP